MQFGVFSVGDVTGDPTPTEAERIGAKVEIAVRAEKVGLDVFATGEHHNPAFVPSSPTTMPGYIATRTERLILSTATTRPLDCVPPFVWHGSIRSPQMAKQAAYYGDGPSPTTSSGPRSISCA